MADLTTTFEELLLEFDVPGVLLAGFERASHWEQARARYERLAASENRTIAAASVDRLTSASGVRTFELSDDDPMAGEWFLLALTPMVSATLFARELPGDPGDDPDDGDERPFLVVWTFDHTVATDIAVAISDLARGASSVLEPFLTSEFVGRVAEPMTHTFGQRYSVATFERLEASRRRWRDLSVQLETARNELHDRTERQRKLERLASVGTMAASVAHELNNPLASITMAANVLGQRDDPEERIRLAEMIETEALRAGRIAGDLLSFVADRELELTTTRLDLWLEGLAAGYRVHGHPVTLSDTSEITLAVDQDRLQQAVSNLIDNAIDAIDPNGDIRIELTATDVEIEIRVIDDGMGIPDRVRPRLFDPFVTSKPRGQGTGLGLPIARAHIQDHRGDLELEHTTPDGTRFLIRLPLTPGSSPASGGPSRAEDGLVVDHRGTGTGRVLVVDDEPPIRALLETLLQRNGWHVVSASGLDDAVGAVTGCPVDIALIDVQLGGDDGPAVLAALEAVQPGLIHRSAFITGAPPEGGDIDGRPVLAKPFSWSDLAQLLSQLGSA